MKGKFEWGQVDNENLVTGIGRFINEGGQILEGEFKYGNAHGFSRLCDWRGDSWI